MEEKKEHNVSSLDEIYRSDLAEDALSETFASAC